MQRVNLSPSGPNVSRFIYGTWRLSDGENKNELSKPENILSRINACLSIGITSFDLADIYGEYGYEEEFGKGLALDPSIRGKIEIITKTGILYPCEPCKGTYVKHYNLTYEYIIQQANRSLSKIGTSYIDILLLHRPSPLMDPKEIIRAFVNLHSAGKVRHFGVSNFTPSQFAMLQKFCPFTLVTNQVEINLNNLNTLYDGTLDSCILNQISPMAWSPLGGGKLFTSTDEKIVKLRDTLTSVGKEMGGLTIDQVVYSFILSHPSKPIIILGTNNIERILACSSSSVYKMSIQQWFSILQAANGGKECP